MASQKYSQTADLNTNIYSEENNKKKKTENSAAAEQTNTAVTEDRRTEQLRRQINKELTNERERRRENVDPFCG